MRAVCVVAIVVVCLIISGVAMIFLRNKKSETVAESSNSSQALRYVALGDSYTIGEGVAEHDRWPNQLVQHLTNDGLSVNLVANPSRTGWTTQDVIDRELPVYLASKPDFATLLIGVNDWVRGVDPEIFRQNVGTILDAMQKELPEDRKKSVVVVTIPDFSTTETGSQYGNGRDIAAGIAEFNDILKSEAEARGLPVADIFTLSQQLNTETGMLVNDGLHPSDLQYAEWEKIIYPLVKDMITTDALDKVDQKIE